jgi:hypothetical protein
VSLRLAVYARKNFRSPHTLTEDLTGQGRPSRFALRTTGSPGRPGGAGWDLPSQGQQSQSVQNDAANQSLCPSSPGSASHTYHPTRGPRLYIKAA